MTEKAQSCKKWEIFLMENSEVAVVQPLVPKLDFGNSCDFEEILADLIQRGYVHLVIDFKYVKIIDSCGLGGMVDGFRQLDGKGWIRLCHLDKNLAKVMRLTRLEDVFQVYKTRDEALAEVGATREQKKHPNTSNIAV